MYRHFAARSYREKPFDIIFASGSPFSSFLVAGLLASRWNIPFVLDYRDPWAAWGHPGRHPFPPHLEREIIDRQNEYMVRIRDYEGLANRILLVLNDLEKPFYGPENRRIVSSRADHVTNVQVMEGLYQGLTEKGSHKRGAQQQ